MTPADPPDTRPPFCCWALVALVGALAANALAQGSAPAKGSGEHTAAVTKRVDGAFIRANAAKTPDWPSYGLDYAETRFSKLSQVNAANVKALGLVWSYDLAIPLRWAARRRCPSS